MYYDIFMALHIEDSILANRTYPSALKKKSSLFLHKIWLFEKKKKLFIYLIFFKKNSTYTITNVEAARVL
jgi:hypothetical protein